MKGALLGLLLALSAGSVRAEEDAARLLGAGVRALSAGDPGEALRSFEQGYALSAQPELLFQLGRVAQAQGRGVAAADLYRRYLEEAGADVTPARREEIGRFLAQQPPGCEVLVAGENGALVFVDDRVVGALPLAVPLWLSPGRHRFRLEKDRRQVETATTLLPRRAAELRFTLTPALAVVTQVPAVVLLADVGGAPAGGQARLAQVLRELGAQQHIVWLPREALTGGSAPPPGCLRDEGCLLGLARRLENAYVLQVQATGREGREGRHGRSRVTARMLDAATGALAANAEQACAECGPRQALALVAQVIGGVLQEGLGRPRGMLEVVAARPARVLVDGREVGETPWRREVFTGLREVVVSAAGHLPYRERVQVQEDRPVQVRAELASLGPEPPPAPLRRRGVRVAKWSTGAVGLAALALGSALWAIDGYQDCPVAELRRCPLELDSRGAGIGLTVAGGAAVLAAVVLFGVDARRPSE